MLAFKVSLQQDKSHRRTTFRSCHTMTLILQVSLKFISQWKSIQGNIPYLSYILLKGNPAGKKLNLEWAFLSNHLLLRTFMNFPWKNLSISYLPLQNKGFVIIISIYTSTMGCIGIDKLSFCSDLKELISFRKKEDMIILLDD